MLDRIRNTSVLGYALICEIDLAGSITGNVLKKSISLACVVDVRLVLLGEVDNLCLATTLEVEYSVVIPAVLIITDEESLGIGRKCSLTCSGKTEEDSGVLSVHVSVS